jgi:hypothetical protein
MKTRLHTMSRLVLTGLLLLTITSSSAQYNNGDTPDPLDGYSTYDQHAESGNTYIDEEYSYFYASRISRFYRPIFGFGYYDSFYTNVYWYNYDPFTYGASIYTSWGWGGFYNPWYRPWGYDMWGWNWGWNSWGQGPGMGWVYQPHSYGGWGYGQGNWNGYGNTCVQNSGAYYGHRGGSNQSAGNPRMSAPATSTKPVPSRLVNDSNRMDDYKPVRKPSPEPQRIGTAPDRTRPVITPAPRPVQYSPHAVPRYEAPTRTPQSPQPIRIHNSNPSRHTPRPQREPVQNYSTPRQTAPRQTAPRNAAPPRSVPSPQRGTVIKQLN